MEHDRRVVRGAAIVANPIIRTHHILQFLHAGISPSDRSSFQTRLRANIDQDIIASEVLDWDVMDTVLDPDTRETGTQSLRRLLTVTHVLDDGSIGFVSYAWIRLFSIHEIIFRELVVEFYSTVRFDLSSEDVLEHTLTFMLGGEPRSLSLIQFAQAVGLYTVEEEANPHFRDFLRDGRTNRYDDLEVAGGWTDIANGAFGSRGPSDVLVRSPVHKLVHRLLSHSIVARKTGHEKVHKVDLFYLHSITQGANVNVAWRLAYWMAHKATGTKATSVICGGQYVTRLARWFGLTPELYQSCTPVIPGMQYMGAHKLLEISIIMRPLEGDFFLWTPPLIAGGRRVRRRRDDPPEPAVAPEIEHAAVPPVPPVYQGPVYDMYHLQLEIARMHEFQQQQFQQMHRYHEQDRIVQERRYQEQQHYQQEHQRQFEYSTSLVHQLFDYHHLPYDPYVPVEFGGPSGVRRDAEDGDSD